MSDWSPFALLWALPAAGMLGSVPTGYALGALSRGVDVRAGGSGNIGATNVNRLLGWRLGLLTLGLDALKGAIPAALGLLLWPSFPAGAALGLAALLGHCWSPLLDWRGGKGVATAAGMGLVLAPLPTAIRRRGLGPRRGPEPAQQPRGRPRRAHAAHRRLRHGRAAPVGDGGGHRRGPAPPPGEPAAAARRRRARAALRLRAALRAQP